VKFGLRPEARWHDGTPITPEDVIFSLEALKKAHPRNAFYYKNVVKAEKTGEHEVTFTFDSKGNRELPQIVGQLTVLPKHWWDAKGANGAPRDITKSSLEMPLGSGPYRVKSVDPGRGITYERVKDYWAKDLPVSKGQWNFDDIKLTYFLDRTPAFEEFKSGKLDYWPERVASQWATGYDFAAVKKGLVKKEAIPIKRVAPMQAFVFNLRRKQFQDPRVRKAFALAYNFEEANKKLFYNLYVRVGSFFDNSELAAKGLPQGRELEILKEVESEVPPEVFTTEWKNPLNATPDDFRNHMREASKLLQEAGWTLQENIVENDDCGFFCSIMRTVGLSSARKENVLRNAAGEELTAEILIDSPEFERIVLPYVQDLQKLGIRASARLVDSTQYKRREDAHDYDIIVDNFAQSESPGNEQRDFWGSISVDRDGTRNTAGIANPAVDKLIDKVVFAKDRDELVAATRALDRVLLWNQYVVPHWHYPYERIATWDIFGRPETLPSQTAALLQIWWIDPEKQKATAAARNK
jgi:microcin C transport system substrate-binding protein